MKVVVLLHEADPAAWQEATAEEIAVVYERHRAFDAAVERRGTLLSGAALSPDRGRTLHAGADPDRTTTDGPYAETAEHLTGFYLIDVESLDVAMELAALLPEGYTVEVRETIALEDY